MSASQISISVPHALSDWVQRRIAAGDYASPAEYVQELIRRDRDDCEAYAEVVAALERGEASGSSARRVPDIMARLRRDMPG